ncbi:histidine kinase [Spongiactinospora sp. TRM90649]|uniref:histidine kinase n=1 Tax=Spongiactinospora sp. TRM90649 TaxID=3031114 RepID=UPI0023F8CABD|nr:histidine kinase [Spongiactinospora sp. TRM90649]MDF5756525.1 histidine kinase [Spongiactinospora sp. TRM90649]
MTRIPRLDTAQRIFSYAADTVAGFFGLLLGLQKLTLMALSAGTEPGIDISLRWRSVAAGICLIGVYVCFWRLHRAAFRQVPRPTVGLVVSAVLAVLAVLFNPMGGELATILWFMGAVLHLRVRVALVAGLVAAVGPLFWLPIVYGAPPTATYWVLNIAIMIGWTGVLGGLMLALRWLWLVTREFHAGQEARATLAVSEERLRFARDLHDLLGHSLSVISLKSELSAKLAMKDPPKAAAEMQEVRRLARESLKEVRAAVRGYRTIDLDAELSSMRAVLEAAGIQCTVDTKTEHLAVEQRALLAWAVREGVTNILKHSTATRCSISIRDGVLEIRNNGVDGTADTTGSGLHGLSERIAVKGGSLSAHTTESGEFLLRAAM